MKKLMVLLLLAMVAGGDFLMSRGGGGINTSTPAGKEAKAYDDHVLQAIDFKDKYDISYLPEFEIEGMGESGTKAFVEDMKSKGSPGVDVINLKHVRGTKLMLPEGVVIELPTDPGQRSTVFGAVSPLFQAYDKPVPTDVGQKYLYAGTWSAGDVKGFLPD